MPPPNPYQIVVDECNTFRSVGEFPGKLWKFCLPMRSSTYKPFGYMLDDTVVMFMKDPTICSHFLFINDKHEVRMKPESCKDLNAWKQAFAEIHNAAHELFINKYQDSKGLKRWPEDDWPVLGYRDSQYPMPCDLAGIFGITTSGVHLNVYSRTKNGGVIDKIWLARRGPAKEQYPDMMDQCAAGGMQTMDNGDALAALVREAKEEAGLSKKEIKTGGAVAQGFVTFFNVRDENAGDQDSGRPEPGIRYVFDLEVEPGFEMTPNESTISGFRDYQVTEVCDLLLWKQFKPNCGLVMLDFLVRHELVPKEGLQLRRELEFPTE